MTEKAAAVVAASWGFALRRTVMLRLDMRSNRILPVWGLTKIVSILEPKDSILLNTQGPAEQLDLTVDSIGHVITGHVTPCN